MDMGEVMRLVRESMQSGSGDDLREPLSACRRHLNIRKAHIDVGGAGNDTGVKIPGVAIEVKIRQKMLHPLPHGEMVRRSESLEDVVLIEAAAV